MIKTILKDLITWFWDLIQSFSNQDSGYWFKDKHLDQWTEKTHTNVTDFW